MPTAFKLIDRPDVPANGNVLEAAPAVLRLRNRLRILNHAKLIQEKLAIGRRWRLIPTEGGRGALNEDILRGVKESALTLGQAISQLAVRSGIQGSAKALVRDLLRSYRTGLLEFHPTDVCDLDCVECHYRNKEDAVIPFLRIPQLLTQLAPQAITVTGGGEPNVYNNGGRRFDELAHAIRSALPAVQLGLINNNSHIPSGTWTEFFAWQRSSVDAATPETYFGLKRRPLLEQVTNNVKRLLQQTGIPHVGVGFLFRRENAGEIAQFLKQWHGWVVGQDSRIQRRFNVQFRPISPGIGEVAGVQSGRPYPDGATHEILREQAQAVHTAMRLDAGFDAFVRNHTNFESYFGSASRFDNSMFLHTIRDFNNCFNALCHRVLRATGEEYPDFLLCNEPKLALGNPLQGRYEQEVLRVALAQYFYFNRLGPFCNPAACRQGWVSHTVENNWDQLKNGGSPGTDPLAYFF